jgi:hypothetical protein
MCRYAFTEYKPHLACFACRKSWKRRLAGDVGHAGPEREPRCPDCGGEAADMGLDFKPPRRQREAEWRLLREMYTIGITFHSCGCGGPGYRPRARSDYRRFLRRTIDEYQGALRHWQAATGSPDRPKAVAYWRERLEAARTALGSA